MTSKAYNYLYTLIGVICGYVIIKAFFFIKIRPVRTDVIQGVLIGFGMAIVTARIVAKLKAKKVNGWTTMFRLSIPGNNMVESSVQLTRQDFTARGYFLPHLASNSSRAERAVSSVGAL